jgi:Ca2+-transporting ATPase
MVGRNAIIRSLPAVETLGSVNIICTDKTGTLTLNRMTATRFYADGVLADMGALDRENTAQALLMECLVLCNDATYTPESQTGDPTEVALLEAGYGLGVEKGELEGDRPRVAEKPFDSERKLMSTLHRHGEGYLIAAKGALDQLLQRCSSVFTEASVVPLNEKLRRQYLDQADGMARDALRVLGAAVKTVQEKPSVEEMEQNLSLVGMVGMIDPPRKEVGDSIERCSRAGIRTVMITGDHRDTALAIARALRIASDPSEVISGPELDDLSEVELRARVNHIGVYARVSPAHKVRIVKALRSKDNIVSMTGDGVNDAPSLRAADIGVAMGITGTDVAKGASDMVLTDDNFKTIVTAIEEGRNIYSNIRKSVLFLLSCNTGEIIAIFLATLFGWPTPLLPIHILWVNLITDTLPALSLGMDPGDPRALDDPPRKPSEGLFAGGGIANVIGNGLLIGILTLFAYRLGIHLHPGSLVHARTMAFGVLSIAQLFHAFNNRHPRRSLFTVGIFSNLFLVGALFIGIGLQVSVITVPLFARLFRVASLSGRDWLLIVALSLLPLLVNEIVKAIGRIGHDTS